MVTASLPALPTLGRKNGGKVFLMDSLNPLTVYAKLCQRAILFPATVLSSDLFLKWSGVGGGLETEEGSSFR
jgi:hypothetical protein